MKVTAAELAGVFYVDLEPASDERGWFARLFDDAEFRRLGLCAHFDQVSLSHNLRKGTLRGMHYQEPPHAEVKLIACVRGAASDVVVDIRPDSPTRHRWLATRLSAADRRALYVPEGFAHGFLALEDETTLLYQISGRYEAAAARGLRWNDPRLNIAWPEGPKTLSTRDQQWPLLAA
jgi:dTDP-4-dehydrorhamnose 3,5-epimerase